MALQDPQNQPNESKTDYPAASSQPGNSNKPYEPETAWKSAPPSPRPAFRFPPGMEQLSKLDQLIIHQQVELLGEPKAHERRHMYRYDVCTFVKSWGKENVLLGTETSNKYEIKNHLGQRVYFAIEENEFFDRNFCGPVRSFTMRVADNKGQEVIHVIRPLRCISCWCPCYLQELEVQAPPGSTVGFITQNWNPIQPKFTIQNERKEDVLKIIGPYGTCGCLGDVDFEVKTLNESATIGRISKYFSGFVNDVFTNADNFGIQFPVNLDVKLKSLIIGACFLICQGLLLSCRQKCEIMEKMWQCSCCMGITF